MFSRLFGVALLLSLLAAAQAQVPALSSRPGAAYTLYLNFGGFNFNGTWGNTGATPGITPAYGTTTQVQEAWARTAEKYAGFDINITTVDPAVAAGQSATDALRQSYYDSTPRLMHTVIGGSGSWFGGGGVSYVGVAPNTFASGGFKTNWVFSGALGNSPRFVADATSHEDGHGLGLSHQGDNLTNTGQSNEYSTNNNQPTPNLNGSFAPNMGVGYYSQRGLWRTGTVSTGTTVQNDVQRILANSGMTLTDDGIGHTFGAATTLPLLGGTTVNSTLAKGVIVPDSAAAPTALGINNYKKDYFKFTMDLAGLVNLKVNDGGDWLTPGVAAVGATLRAKLNIYGASDLVTPLFTGVEAADTLSTAFSGNLAAGNYFAEITSFGGLTSSFDPTAQYYTMGSYVLSGSGFVVIPEPGTLVLLSLCALPCLTLLRRRAG